MADLLNRQGFLGDLIRENMPIWDDCLKTDFIRGIADGTLPRECFKGYMVDDSLYLREYARVFAWGMLKAKTMEDIRTCYSMLSYVNEGEGSTRLYYLREFHITDEDIQPLPLRPQNYAYTQAMITAAKTGEGVVECLMACLPCMLSYGYIFRKVIDGDPSLLDGFYGRYLKDYLNPGFDVICEHWLSFVEEQCKSLSPERLEQCRKAFTESSYHELHFWEMSAQPRTDI